jgi:hypothetical protein
MYRNGFGALAMLEEVRQLLAVQFIESPAVEEWCHVLTQLQQEVLQDYLIRRGWVEEVPEEPSTMLAGDGPRLEAPDLADEEA